MYSIYIILLISFGSTLAWNVTYTLTTPEGVSRNFTNDNYTSLDFNTNRHYKIICSGWRSTSRWYVNITREYMKKGNVNVIAAHYADAVSDRFYFGAVANVPKIAEIIANLIIALNSTKNISFQKFHIIGHSLGAHIAGTTGEIVNSTKSVQISRVTGLDPAALDFYIPLLPYPDHNRISKDDAHFVDIIHTSINGISRAIGKADFFPNGELKQPGCSNSTNVNGCNHGMSVVFFILSIIKEKFEATKCSSYSSYQNGDCANETTVLMGDPVKTNITGKYYLNTSASLVDDFESIFYPNGNGNSIS